ncbi:hypothetical protein GCK32_022754, partial [Trichostrongylus colubriformis]
NNEELANPETLKWGEHEGKLKMKNSEKFTILRTLQERGHEERLKMKSDAELASSSMLKEQDFKGSKRTLINVIKHHRNRTKRAVTEGNFVSG